METRTSEKRESRKELLCSKCMKQCYRFACLVTGYNRTPKHERMVNTKILSALAAKLCSPFGTVLQVFLADCRSRGLNSLDEVLDHEGRLQKLFGIDIHPGHLCCTLVAR